MPRVVPRDTALERGTAGLLLICITLSLSADWQGASVRGWRCRACQKEFVEQHGGCAHVQNLVSAILGFIAAVTRHRCDVVCYSGVYFGRSGNYVLKGLAFACRLIPANPPRRAGA